MEYRRDIDGLRAVAVLPVMLFHAGVPGFAGGFVGVDVFFVVSGFLITGIILSQVRAGTFSIWQFYDRRARRILPALLFVIFVTTVAASAVMVPGQFKEYGQSVVASLLFSANVFFWLKQDYWSQSAEFLPLLHIWSLGVEEQFYLLTPLLVLLAKRRVLLVALVLIGVFSLTGMLYMHQRGATSAAFYLLPFRAWEIAAGSVAALIHASLRPAAWHAGVAGAALLGLVACFALLDERASVLMVHGLPVMCTFALVLFSRGPVATVLGASSLVRIGLWSYSLYLFHQPVLALGRLAAGRSLHAAETAVALATTFALAAFSYSFIETPCRSPAAGRLPRVRYALAGLALTLLTAGGVLHLSSGLREVKLAFMDERMRVALRAYEEEKAARFATWAQYIGGSSRPFAPGSTTNVLFAGDSLAEDLYVSAAMGLRNPNIQIRRIAIEDDCYRTGGATGVGKELPTCREELARLVGSPLLRDATVVVLANSWQENAPALTKALDIPAMQGKRVIVYKTHAFMEALSIVLSLDRFGYDPASPELRRFVHVNRHQRTMAANDILQRISVDRGVATIDATEFFCKPGECTVFDPAGRPLLIDRTHLSGAGYRDFQEWFGRSLMEKVQPRKGPH